MSGTIQYILVLTLVVLCVAYVLRGAWRTLKQRSGGLGKCCEKGCGTQNHADPAPRTIFMPAENLTVKRK